MKKKLVLATIAYSVIFPMFANANEISAGTLEISGGTNSGLGASSWTYSYNTGRVNNYALGELSLSTTIQYFLTPHTAVGVGAAYDTYSRNYQNNVSKINVTRMDSTSSISPTITQHFPISPTSNAFFSARLGLSHENYSETGSPSFTSNGVVARVALGVANFLTESVSLNTALSYNMSFLHGTYSDGVVYDYSYGRLMLGLSLSMFI